MSKRRYPRFGQDFSGESLTDTSFAPSCDVNNIIRHYEATGFDPHAHRKELAHFGEVPSLTFSEAMQNKAAFDSYVAENPQWREKLSDARRATIAEDGSNPLADGSEAPDASGVAKPAPQGASDGES